MFRVSKSSLSLEASQSLKVVGDDDDDRTKDVSSKKMQEAELRRSERQRVVELREDAFILPTGNYSSNTCISSTPVAHPESVRGGEMRNPGRGEARDW